MSLRLLSTFIALPISSPNSPPPPRYWAVLLWPALLGTQATTIAFRLARLCCGAVTYPYTVLASDSDDNGVDMLPYR